MAKTKMTGYWMLICNPKTWQIDEFLETKEVFKTWKITSWQKKHFKPKQLGFMRVGLDKRNLTELDGKPRLESGIYAIVEILSEASQMPEIDSAFWLNPKKVEIEKPRVKIKILKNFLDNPILMDTLKSNDILKNETSLIKGQEASTWPISEKAFNEIINLSNTNIESINEAKSESYYSLDDIRKLENKYRQAPPRIKEIISRKIERGSISKEIKRVNNYECQICKSLNQPSKVFKKRKGEYYIETHHVIPVSELKEGSLGVMNLITVCPNHHRQLHYGNVQIVDNNESVFVFLIDNKKITIEKIKL
ncbi:EVE domain-containing protein [Psychroserpens jangbogonensis]|uniref:EVE domain-containing protein n=1 Tax=Psychroserpens jangbogonensis TaxID=1484460 RepID=UPI00053E6EED|nr:EVE domain-containing protein [Psychroserpens jangbogonensis]